MKKLVSILFWSVISAAFIGPGTVTTCIAAGAKHQTQLLWALIFATIACIMLQEAAARISIASGKNLGEALKQKYNWQEGKQWKLWGLFIAVALGCAAYEAGNILGAVAGIQLLFDTSQALLTTGIVLIATVLLWSGNFKLIANILGGVVALMGIAFLALAMQLELNWSNVMLDAVVPTIPQNSYLLVIGLMGTTIVPYNIFLGSGIGGGQQLKEMRFGLSVAILLGGLISISILLVGTQLVGEVSFQAMAETLQQIGGEYTAILLAIGLGAAGLTSSITAPFAAAITAQTLFGRDKYPQNSWAFRSIWLLALCIGGFFGVLDVKPIPIIITAQALNGLLLPIITYLLVGLINDSLLLKQYINKPLANLAILLVLGISAFLGFLNLAKVAYTLVGLPFQLDVWLFGLLMLVSLGLVIFAGYQIKQTR
ncbi:MAG: NRAMP family divalent metal transporter [Flammeovirgaceae bacterium]